MKLFLSRLKWRFEELLGFDRMGAAFPPFAQSYSLLLVYTTLETIFMNTLLVRQTGDPHAVMYYKILVFILTAIAMHGSAAISRRISPVLAIQIGMSFYFILYVFLFFFTGSAGRLMPLLGVVSGIGCGFYWCAHNSLISLYTEDDNRDVGMGIIAVLQGIMTLILPVVAGFIIAAFPANFIGYRIMFGFGMLAVGAQFVCSFRLHMVESDTTRKTNFRLAFQQLKKHRVVQIMFPMQFFRGLRDGTFSFFLSLYLFEILPDEGWIGVNTFLTGIASIAAAWLYGRLVAKHARSKYAAVSVIILLLGSLFLFFKVNPLILFLFTILNSFFQIFLNNSESVTVYTVVSRSAEARLCISEMFAIKEVILSLGRVVGVGLVLVLPQTPQGYVQAIVLLTATQFVVAGCISLIQKTMEKENRLAALK